MISLLLHNCGLKFCFLSFKTLCRGQGPAAWCSYSRTWSCVHQMLIPTLINVPTRSHKQLLAAISAVCSFQRAVKQSAISQLTICQRCEDPAQEELKETGKGNAKMWATCAWCDYQSFRSINLPVNVCRSIKHSCSSQQSLEQRQDVWSVLW